MVLFSFLKGFCVSFHNKVGGGFAFSVVVSPDDADVKLDSRALRVEHDNGEEGELGSSTMEEER